MPVLSISSVIIQVPGYNGTGAQAEKQSLVMGRWKLVEKKLFW